MFKSSICFIYTSSAMSKIILVTGANTGIGFALVRLLAEKNHTVYLGARNKRAGKKAVCVYQCRLLGCIHHTSVLMNLF